MSDKQLQNVHEQVRKLYHEASVEANELATELIRETRLTAEKEFRIKALRANPYLSKVEEGLETDSVCTEETTSISRTL